MKSRNRFVPRFVEILLVSILLAMMVAPAFGQARAEPDRETLLNDLRILYWPQPGNPNVLLRLRIHSGAAFDLSGKAGMMALLGDALFPDSSTREYVTDELGGKLEVTTTYDAIDVSISGKASALERMIDLLRGAVTTTQLDAETVNKLRDARLAAFAKTATAADKADEAILSRLFGTFPYAHPPQGTPTTVAKIDRADLLMARDRFLYSDNASLAVVGGVDKPRLTRALRQLLGPWAKSSTTVPATFRQPAAPDSRVLVLDSPGESRTQVRIAVRGLSRADADASAADMLAIIANHRWQSAVADLSNATVRHEPHLLPGIFLFSASTQTATASKAVAAAQQIMSSLAQSGPTAAELDVARAELLSRISKQTSDTEGSAAAWLDVDTFKLSQRPSTIASFVSKLAPGDIQRVASNLFKDRPVAIVVVGQSDELKSAFAGNLDTGVVTSGPAVQTKKP